MVTPVSTSSPVTTGTNTSTTNATSTNGTTASSASNSTTNSAKTAAQALITSLGSGSGVDVKSLATNLANAEIAPQKANIQGKIDKSNAMISGFGAIKYVLGNLQTAFADLKDRSDFSGITSNNSQPNAFTVSTDSIANAGTHNIVVNSLAQSQRNLSTGFSGLTDQLNGGSGFSLTLTINGTSTPITVADGQDTPQGVVSAINAGGPTLKQL